MSAPRTFAQDDHIPDDVSALRGFDGSRWVRDTDRSSWGTDEEWVQVSGVREMATQDLLDEFAPMTEDRST